VICAACDAVTEVDPCATCGESPLVAGRYRLDARLGTGASGATWKGTRLADGVTVAIKERPVHDPALAELARREARVLSEVRHDAIPQFIEELPTGAGKARRSWLVEAFVPGVTLAEESGARRYTDEDVLDILDELLGVLEYLHALRPPVLHRDLKPANVLRDPSGALHIVDFGSVRDATVDGLLGGKTVTGTFGYMAPECFGGDASERSDLFGLGALAIALLSRRDPATLHSADGRFEWREHVRSARPIVDLLAAMTDADPRHRPASATEVRARIARLRTVPETPRAPPPPAPPVVATLPTRTRTLERLRDEEPSLEIPELPEVSAPFGVRRSGVSYRAAPGTVMWGVLIAVPVFAGLFAAASVFRMIETIPRPDSPVGTDRIVEGLNVDTLAQDAGMQDCALDYRAAHPGHDAERLVVSVKYAAPDVIESTWTYWGGPPYGVFWVEETRNPCFFEAAGLIELPTVIETGRYYMVPFPPP
jgi:serine/threonine protein kinase